MGYIDVIHKKYEIASLQTLYHYTDINSLYNILKANRLRLISVERVSDAEKHVGSSNKLFFMSFTRSKVGGYHYRTSWGANYSVLLELDYDVLRQNNKIIPVDYWGANFRKTDQSMNEMEERVVSNKQFIPLKPGMIKAAHIMVKNFDDRHSYKLRRILIDLKKRNIKGYVYNNRDSWLSMRSQRAMKKEEILPFIKGQELNTSSVRTNWLEAYYELYAKPKGQKLSDRADRFRRSILYYGHDAKTQLKADLHNEQKSDYNSKLIPIISKLGGIDGFIDFLNKKYA